MLNARNVSVNPESIVHCSSNCGGDASKAALQSVRKLGPNAGSIECLGRQKTREGQVFDA
jgi:hypothetical protein